MLPKAAPAAASTTRPPTMVMKCPFKPTSLPGLAVMRLGPIQNTTQVGIAVGKPLFNLSTNEYRTLWASGKYFKR
jgi:hypothetical protein